MVKLEIGGADYTIDDLWFEGPDGPDLLFLRLMAADFAVNGVSGADPDADLTLANMAIEEMGQGEIIKNVAPESVDGRIY